jgi:hypothetical protein
MKYGCPPDSPEFPQGPLLQLDDDFMQLVCRAVCEVMGMEV